MELHQLRCFVAIMEEGGFNRATTRLHMTQPALSYQIKQLEQSLGVTLFHRRSRGVTATEAGRVLAEHAREVLEAVRKAQRAVEELSAGVADEVRIGTVNSVGIHFLPPVLWKMREKYPKARPTVLYRYSTEIMEALRLDKVDVALVADPPIDRRMRQETVIEERVSLVCGRSHPLFGRTSVRPSEIKGLQLISLSADNPTGRLIRQYLARIGVSMEPVVYTDNVETVKKMVEVGLGVAFLPDMVTSSDVACAGDPPGKLARIEVGPPLIRRIVLVTWKHLEMTRAIASFIDELRWHGARWRGCVDVDDI